MSGSPDSNARNRLHHDVSVCNVLAASPCGSSFPHCFIQTPKPGAQVALTNTTAVVRCQFKLLEIFVPQYLRSVYRSPLPQRPHSVQANRDSVRCQSRPMKYLSREKGTMKSPTILSPRIQMLAIRSRLLKNNKTTRPTNKTHANQGMFKRLGVSHEPPCGRGGAQFVHEPLPKRQVCQVTVD